jgi:hypothetical protein
LPIPCSTTIRRRDTRRFPAFCRALREPLWGFSRGGSPPPVPTDPVSPVRSTPGGTPPECGRTPSRHAPGRGTPPAGRRAPPDDHHPVLDPVPLLLPRVVPLLPPSRPGMARSVASKKGSRVSPPSSSTLRSGVREVPARSGWRGLAFRPPAESSTPNR